MLIANGIDIESAYAECMAEWLYTASNMVQSKEEAMEEEEEEEILLDDVDSAHMDVLSDESEEKELLSEVEIGGDRPQWSRDVEEFAQQHIVVKTRPRPHGDVGE